MIVDNILYPMFPLKFIGITSGFKTPSRPTHMGVDFGWNRNHGGPNHELIAVCDAKVIAIKDDVKDGTGTGYGNYVLIQSTKDSRKSFMYGHVLKGSIKVKVGDTVKAGAVLCKMGNSGDSTGTHLHFEVRIDNIRVNPLDYIYLKGDEYVTADSKTKYNLKVIPEPAPKPEPTPEPVPTTELKVGDRVKIIGAYAESAYAKKAKHTRGVGYDRYITKIYKGTNFPYQVGNEGKTDSQHTTGFATADALQKL